MRKRRYPFLTFLLFLLAVVLCVGGILLSVSFFSLPNQAEKVFGPPAPGLDLDDRLYLIALLLAKEEELTTPLDPAGTPHPFQVQLGESASSVVKRLKAEGFIANTDAFRAYLEYSGLDTGLQAGEHSLSPAMAPLEIARAMQDASPMYVTFNILAGWRLEEIAAILPTSGLQVTPQEFISAAYAPAPDRLYFEISPATSVEGFLSPGEYKIRRDTHAEDLLEIFVNRFEENMTPELQQGFVQQGLSVFQAVTLASIVERESVIDDEMPLIASVFLNRLSTNMKLDSDPTVQFALGYNKKQKSWWTNPLSAANLEIDSLYNTYRYPDLPPGPIANPGLNALQAVAYPEQSEYFFFRSACDNSGRHNFAKTLEEHIQNACP